MLTLDTQEIALILGVKRKTVTDKIVKQPGFPAPAVNLSQKLRRWAQDDVLAYVKSGRRSARATPDTVQKDSDSR
jgi:predicted DNA-binding transcriptional regulator AlpA